MIPPTFHLLLKSGADINLQNTHGSTVLMKAAGFARYDVVLYLLRLPTEVVFYEKLLKDISHDLDLHERILIKDSFKYKNKKEVERWFAEHGIEIKKL